jgi:replicative DNA helicase
MKFTDQSQTFEKAMPSDTDAERALLGSVLMDPEMFRKINLSPEDLYILRHRYVWVAMRDLIAAGNDVDFLTVNAELDKRGKLDEVGGASYLTELINSTPTSLHAESYAEIIRDKANRRRVLQLASKLANSAMDSDRKLDDAIATAATDLVRSVRQTKGAVHAGEFYGAVYDEAVERGDNPSAVYGIPTGFDDIDKINYGWQPGTVTIISGEPGLGKSLLACQTAYHAAEKGHPFVIYELEMRGVSVARRWISGFSKIPTRRMLSGTMGETDWTMFTKQIDRSANIPLYMSDASDWTTTGIRADLARMIELYGVEGIVIDYLGKLQDMAGQDENHRITHISSMVANIAKDFGVAVLSIQSMNKTGLMADSKKTGHLSGPVGVGYDADDIIFMTRDLDSDNKVNLEWSKAREGDENRFASLVKLPGLPRFEAAAHV